MSYHPLIGIAIFIIFLFLAFFLGRNCVTKDKKAIVKEKKSKNNSESISPDAYWLERKK